MWTLCDKTKNIVSSSPSDEWFLRKIKDHSTFTHHAECGHWWLKTKNIVSKHGSPLYRCVGRLSSSSEQKPKARWGHCGLSRCCCFNVATFSVSQSCYQYPKYWFLLILDTFQLVLLTSWLLVRSEEIIQLQNVNWASYIINGQRLRSPSVVHNQLRRKSYSILRI